MNFPYLKFNKCSKQINIKVNKTMKHVHWIGTGLSSIPGIRRLANNLENLTVWNRTLEKAENSINHVNKNNDTAKKYDIDQTGYRLLFNTNSDAMQTVFHIHLHLIGGEKLKNI